MNPDLIRVSRSQIEFLLDRKFFGKDRFIWVSRDRIIELRDWKDSIEERAFDESEHPRDEHGKWTDAGGESGGTPKGPTYESERLIKDGPLEGFSRVGIVKDKYIGLWGGSHTGSYIITGYAAKQMGISGYKDPGADKEDARLGDKFLVTIRDDAGASEPLYHGFANTEKLEWKTGDTVRLPLLASSGDLEDSAGYGVSYVAYEGYEKGGPKPPEPTVFEFPKGTKMAGYSRWDREASKEFGYQWSEAIVAGEFKVVGEHMTTEGGWRKVPVRVVELQQTGFFDPDTKTWHKT